MSVSRTHSIRKLKTGAVRITGNLVQNQIQDALKEFRLRMFGECPRVFALELLNGVT
jgi:hypothetical protein